MKLKTETYLVVEKLENSIRQAEINSFTTVAYVRDNAIDFFHLTLMIDPEVKDHKSRVYGIVDAIGTLGGAYEIIFWIVMLFYGSIRKNLYQFSIVNSLIQNNDHQKDESKVDEGNLNNDMITRRRCNQQASQSKIRLRQTKVHVENTNQRNRTIVNKKIF